MYLKKVEVKTSGIEGLGVFAIEAITKGDIVWKFDPNHDHTLSAEEYDVLDDKTKMEIRKVAYVSPTTGKWVYPPKNDPARFTNHTGANNNLTTKFDPSISDEPFFVANRDIAPGEELTVNYVEFDASIKDGRPETVWHSLKRQEMN